MAWGSTVPAAIGALYALASSGLTGVIVSDGPVMTTDEESAGVVTIGYSGGDDETAAEATGTPDGWGSAPDRESFTISCAASVLSGDNDLVAARTAAYALVAQVGGLLAADHTLGGVVLRASVDASTLRQSQTSRGAIATVSFAVACEAFTRL